MTFAHDNDFWITISSEQSIESVRRPFLPDECRAFWDLSDEGWLRGGIPEESIRVRRASTSAYKPDKIL